MTESNSTALSSDKCSKSDLLVVFGVILPITLSASFLTYNTIVQYFKWKSLDTERKTKEYESQVKCKQMDYEFQMKCKQLDYESQLKYKQIDNEGKQLEYQSQIKLKELDNEGKQLDNELKVKIKDLDPK